MKGDITIRDLTINALDTIKKKYGHLEYLWDTVNRPTNGKDEKGNDQIIMATFCRHHQGTKKPTVVFFQSTIAEMFYNRLVSIVEHELRHYNYPEKSEKEVAKGDLKI